MNVNGKLGAILIQMSLLGCQHYVLNAVMIIAVNSLLGKLNAHVRKLIPSFMVTHK